jgi:hypothetical protein
LKKRIVQILFCENEERRPQTGARSVLLQQISASDVNPCPSTPAPDPRGQVQRRNTKPRSPVVNSKKISAAAIQQYFETQVILLILANGVAGAIRA